jgi:hypothetical protein
MERLSIGVKLPALSPGIFYLGVRTLTKQAIQPSDTGAAGNFEPHRDSPGFPRLTWTGTATTACLLALPVMAQADPAFTLPVGLSPGEQYRLMFVTTNTTPGDDNLIADYNSFVSTDAALNPSLPSTTWKAVASTSTVSAATNIDCGTSCDALPVFLVNGTQVANSSGTGTNGLFSGALLVPINVTESGTSAPTGYPNFYVWTGSTPSGGIAPINSYSYGGPSDDEFTVTYNGPLGTATPYPTVGDDQSSDDEAFNFGSNAGEDTQGLYAISGALTVPGASVPAPGGAPLFLLGGLVAFVARKFRRGERQTV